MEIFTVKQDVSIEYTEKKSLFIGHAFFVTEESEAMAAIASVKKQHAEATHNVWAYSLRKFSAQRFSDDGEPQGTAGMPVLSVLLLHGISAVFFSARAALFAPIPKRLRWRLRRRGKRRWF